jgi:UDP-N-acetylmuramate dehydrogenase
MPSLNPKSLRADNTFGLDCTCRDYASFRDRDTLRELLLRSDHPLLILGGGSNLLLPPNLQATVLHNAIPGIMAEAMPDGAVRVTAGAGESWHHLVTWAVHRELSGLENLALIPGTVGAAPIQNIGAYGVELGDLFEYLEAMDRETGTIRRFDRQECAFGYRDSVFKQDQRDRWVILQVSLRLHTRSELRLDYGDIRGVLEEMGRRQPCIRDVYEAVIRIRRAKLPDPACLGNAGSFFKNPVLGPDQLARLLERGPGIPCFPLPDGRFKLPAAWLIDRAGWKGHRRGACGVHEHQALVLVNYGGACAADIVGLARDIVADIRKRYGVDLENEVNILDEQARTLHLD